MSAYSTRAARSDVATDEGHPADLQAALEVFLAERTRLFRVAYKIVGDAGTAEDVVQDAWVRWQRADRASIRNPAAFLTTATTHLAINVVQSARHRHELPTDASLVTVAATGGDPSASAERSAAVAESLGLMMARLTPRELAVCVLRTGFDYAYPDIARVLHTSSPNARQLLRRARVRLAGDPVRSVDAGAHRTLVAAFLKASATGHLADLEAALAPPRVQCTSSAAPARSFPVGSRQH